jgi:hypothetical protein
MTRHRRFVTHTPDCQSRPTPGGGATADIPPPPGWGGSHSPGGLADNRLQRRPQFIGVETPAMRPGLRRSNDWRVLRARSVRLMADLFVGSIRIARL